MSLRKNERGKDKKKGGDLEIMGKGGLKKRKRTNKQLYLIYAASSSSFFSAGVRSSSLPVMRRYISATSSIVVSKWLVAS